MPKKPKKKTPTRRTVGSGASLMQRVRRLGIWLIASGCVALQTTSCGLMLPGGASSPPGTAQVPTSPSAPARVPRAQTAQHFKDCPAFFAAGTPPQVAGSPKLRDLCYDAFAVLHSGQTRTPVFVAQKLNRRLVQEASKVGRSDGFFADARLPKAERAELADYRNSGYSRGHLAPAGDMPTVQAMSQSFSLANMVPQDQKQNSGSWAKIEADVRKYALRAQGDVYVITGPVFAPGGPAIGPGRVQVPQHLYKLVYDATTGRAWVHWQDNVPGDKVKAPISYEELRSRLRVELLPGVRTRH